MPGLRFSGQSLLHIIYICLSYNNYNESAFQCQGKVSHELKHVKELVNSLIGRCVDFINGAALQNLSLA